MGKGTRNALAFVAGVGSGYMGAKRQKTLDEERQEDRAMRRDEHEARQAERRRVEGDRIALSNAAKPVQVEEGAGGMIRPVTMDDRDVGLPENADLPNQGLQSGGFRVAGTTYTDRSAAEGAAAKANSPEAVNSRISLAMRERGNPTAALQHENAARQGEASALDLAERRWRQQLGDSIGRGHEGLAEMVSKSQGGGLAPHQLKPVVSPDGKQVTYHKVNPDGSTQPTQYTFSNDQEGVIRAAYMLDKTVKPETRYQHMIAEDKATAAAAAKEKELELRKRQLEEVTIPTAESRAALAEVRAQIAGMREARLAAGGGGKSKSDDKAEREERMRYTTLFTDAGRRMQDVSKTLNVLQTDRQFMREAAKPGTPQAERLAGLQSDLAAYREQRELYQGLLSKDAGGKAGKEPSLADADPKPGGKPSGKPAAGGAPVKVASQAERDKLPKGTRYVAPDGTVRVKN